ncbi:MAG: molecular chaperone TorD family protein [Dehalococcoidia bacterium]
MTETHEQAPVRSGIYQLLATAFLYPDPETGGVARLTEASGRLAKDASQVGPAQVAPALRRVKAALKARTDDALLQDYIKVFGHGASDDCSPYEGEYDQAHVFQKSQTLADLNASYHAFGVAPSPQIKERFDHVSVELEFMRLLTLKEGYAELHGHGEDKLRICRDAQRAFLASHLGPWVLSFARRVERKAGAGSAYGPLARLLEAHIEAEMAMFRLPASRAGTSERGGDLAGADLADTEASCEAA